MTLILCALCVSSEAGGEHTKTARRNLSRGGQMEEQNKIKRICIISTIFYVSILASIVLILRLQSGTEAADVTIAWNPKQSSDIAGYRIYYGTCSGIYTSRIDAGKATNIRISDLNKSQIYYFTATTYDRDGYESSFLEEAVYDPSSTNVENGRIWDTEGKIIFGFNKIASSGRNSYLQLRF
jgi:hypothetical protein